MIGAKRTWTSWPDPMSAHFNLQPSVAASRTAAAAPRCVGLHQPPARTSRPARSDTCLAASFLRYRRMPLLLEANLEKKEIDFWHNVYQNLKLGKNYCRHKE